MASYRYAGRDAAGERVVGVIEAQEADNAAELLRLNGIVPIEIATERRNFFRRASARPVANDGPAPVTFDYLGRDRGGKPVRGSVLAPDADAVAHELSARDITPVEIKKAPPRLFARAAGGGSKKAARGRVTLDDLIFFCRQMHTLEKAGVPVMQALASLRRTATNPALGRVIEGLEEALDAGMDLTSAMRREPKVFPPLMIGMVQVGETTGRLSQVFENLYGYLERERDTRARIKQALRYPSFVVIAIGIALAILNIFVIPVFARVFAGFNAELPWATRLLIATSNYSVQYWPIMLAQIVGLVLAFRFAIATPRGRLAWDRIKLRLPVVGKILYQALLGRFARSLATTMRAGVPLVQGLRSVAEAADNAYLARHVTTMREGVERGETVMRTAAATGLFTPLVLQMLSVGEETGAVDNMLFEVAEYYDREVDFGLKNLSSAIEPILITFIGVIVLIMALGIFLPMWDLASVALHH
jgi:MSHA biogenesis protein MshG